MASVIGFLLRSEWRGGMGPPLVETVDQRESDILRAIYAAPLRPAAIEQALDLLAIHFGSAYCMLAVIDRRGGANWTHTSRDLSRIIAANAEWYGTHMRTYGSYYSRNIARVVAAAPLQIVNSRDFAISDEEHEVEDRISAESERIVGHYHRLGGAFGVQNQRLGFLGLGLARNADPSTFLADPSHALWLQHFEQADVHAAVFASLRERFGVVLGVLDRLLLGIVIIDCNGHVLVANKVAQSICEAQSAVGIRNGRLTAPLEFSAALHKILTRDLPLEKTSVGMVGAFGSADEPERYACFADRLEVPANEFDGAATGAVLVLVDTRESRLNNTALAASLFNLTPAEAESLELLIAGDTYNFISEKRNVSRDTTKSHVSSILRKVGVQRVPQLILKVAKIDPPFDFS